MVLIVRSKVNILYLCLLCLLPSCELEKSHSFIKATKGNIIKIENGINVELYGISDCDFNLCYLNLVLKNKKVWIYNKELKKFLDPHKNERVLASDVYILNEKYSIFNKLIKLKNNSLYYKNLDSLTNEIIKSNQKAIFLCRQSKTDSNEYCNNGTCFFIEESGVFLSAAHTFKNNNNDFYFYTNCGDFFTKFKVLKFNSQKDFIMGALLADMSIKQSAVTVADTLPMKGSFIYTIGYPKKSMDCIHLENQAITSGKYFHYSNNKIVTSLISIIGNSGGPLFTRDGKVFGMVLASSAEIHTSTNIEAPTVLVPVTVSIKICDIK